MDASNNKLRPLTYHAELRDYLKSQEPELWGWFASARAQADYTESLRHELLKSTYRLDAAAHPELYQAVELAKARLELDLPITLYQAQNSPQPNATLYFIPGEGHVVFSGALLALLDGEEIKSVLGHELAHHHLWGCEGGEFHVADRLIQAVAGDPRAARSHECSARRFQLYTEIFADRGSLCVTGDLNPVVAGLVKTQTGLGQVSASSYLRQAEEIFVKGGVLSEGVSHPETFIRARALSLWQEQGDQAAAGIAELIEGSLALDELDLLGQARLTGLTRGFLEYLLQPKWFQTPATLGHAKLFFADFQPLTKRDSNALDAFQFSDSKLRDYFCYLLLDFVTADPELEDLPLAAALDLSRHLELGAQFEKLAARELKMKLRDLRKLKDHAAEMLAKAEAAR